jgi:hypothetical protein
MLKKKIWANFQRIIELFTQKIVTKLSEIWVWDPGSEIRDPEKPHSGSRIQGSKGTGSRIRIRNTAGSATSLSGTGTNLFYEYNVHLHSLFWQSSVAHFQFVSIEQPGKNKIYQTFSL